MDKDQQEQFAAAVERKKAEAQEASEAQGAAHGSSGGKVALDSTGQGQPGVFDTGTQDNASPRDKNSGHGKVTADKWNQ